MASKLYAYAIAFYYNREIKVSENMKSRLEILRDIVQGYKQAYGKLSSKRLRHIVNFFIDNHSKIRELQSNGSCKICGYSGENIYYHISKHLFSV